MSGRRRSASVSPPPPEVYKPPKLDTGTPPHPDVSARTGKPRDAPRGRKLSVQYATGKAPSKYGRHRLPGQIVYSFDDVANDAFWYVLLFSRKKGQFVKLTYNSSGVIQEFTTPPTGDIAVWFYDSTQVAADANLAAADSTWNELLTGKTYAVVKLSNVTTKFPQIPNLTFEILFHCLDPSTDTVVASEYPAVHFYDWLLDSEGKALRPSRVNKASFITARSVCAESVGGAARFTSHMSIEGQDTSDIEKTFALACDGIFFFSQNRWHLVIDRPRASVATYTDAEIITDPEHGGISPDGYREDPQNRINEVVINWTDTSNGWEIVPARLQTTALQEGREARRTATYEMPWLHAPSVVQRKLVYLLKSYQYDFKLPVKHTAATSDRQVGEVITQSVAARGISAQQFVIVHREKDVHDNTFVDLLLEYNAEKYSDSTATVPSKILSTLPTTTRSAPEEIVDLVVSGSSTATLSFNLPRIRSTTLYAASFWSNGASLGSFDASKVNDGVKNVTCFTTSSGAWLKHDAGASGKRFREVTVTHLGALSGLITAGYSTDGTSWTTLTTITKGMTTKDIGGGYFETTIYWADLGANKRYWRIDFAAGNTVTEVHLAEYFGVAPTTDSFRVYNAGGSLLGSPIDVWSIPTTARPLNVEAAVERTAHEWDGSSSFSITVRVTTVNANGVESTGVVYSLGYAVMATNAVDPHVPQSMTAMTLTNGLNSDVAISSGPGIQRVTGPTAAFSIGGFATPAGGMWLPLQYSGSHPLSLVNQSASSTAANRIITGTGADVVFVGPCTLVFWYNATDSRWHLVDFSVSPSHTADLVRAWIASNALSEVVDAADGGAGTITLVNSVLWQVDYAAGGHHKRIAVLELPVGRYCLQVLQRSLNVLQAFDNGSGDTNSVPVNCVLEAGETWVNDSSYYIGKLFGPAVNKDSKKVSTTRGPIFSINTAGTYSVWIQPDGWQGRYKCLILGVGLVRF